MKERIVCPICGTEYDGETLDICPYCQWGYLGFENELEPNEKEGYNLISIEDAKKLVSEGKTIFGDPLPKE